MAEELEPIILQAFFSVNPVNVGGLTVIKVAVEDFTRDNVREIFTAKEIASGEV